MEIKKLEKEELAIFKELLLVFERVFKMDDIAYPEDHQLEKLLSNPDFMVFVAVLEEKVIGGLTVFVQNHYYYREPIAHIYDLAVLQEFQRKGAGTQLIKATCDFCKKKGFREVFVQADKIDDYALEFYRSTNPTGEDDVSHYYYMLK